MVLAGFLPLPTQSQPISAATGDIPCATGRGMCAGSPWKALSQHYHLLPKALEMSSIFCSFCTFALYKPSQVKADYGRKEKRLWLEISWILFSDF